MPKIKWDRWKPSKTVRGTYLRMGRSGTGKNALVYLQSKVGKKGKIRNHRI